MKWNVFRLKIWMLMHMIIMNSLLMFIIDFDIWYIIIGIFTFYFTACIIEELFAVHAVGEQDG